MTDLSSMSLSQLRAYSARLHDEYYAIKDEIQRVKNAIQQKGIEEDSLRQIAEAQSKLSELGATRAQVVEPEPIQSDMNVSGLPRWIGELRRLFGGK